MPIPDGIQEKYKDRAPTELLEEWELSQGFCSYGNGLFWMVNPDDFTGVLEEWLIDPGTSFVFGRTAFGDLLIWNGERVQYLSVHHGELDNKSKSLRRFVNHILIYDEFLEVFVFKNLFDVAVKKRWAYCIR